MAAKTIDLIRCVLQDLYVSGYVSEFDVGRGMSWVGSEDPTDIVKEWSVAIYPGDHILCVRLYRDMFSVYDDSDIQRGMMFPLGHRTCEWMPALFQFIEGLVGGHALDGHEFDRWAAEDESLIPVPAPRSRAERLLGADLLGGQ